MILLPAVDILEGKAVRLTGGDFERQTVYDADPLQAAAWAVYVHGRSADVLAREIGPVGYLARQLLAGIPRELARLAPTRR